MKKASSLLARQAIASPRWPDVHIIHRSDSLDALKKLPARSWRKQPEHDACAPDMKFQQVQAVKAAD